MDFQDRFRYFLEYAAARALLFFLSLWPRGAGLFLGRFFGRAIGAVLWSRTGRMEQNLSAAFPDWGRAKVRGTARGVWRHLGESIWEFSKIPRLDRASFLESVVLHGRENIEKSVAAKKGMIFFTGHCGNWEYSSIALAILLASPLAAVARRMKNPYMNDYVTRMRSHFGVRVLMHKQAVRESIRWLKDGGAVGLLIDQRITDGALKVPFFGRPAFTTGMTALLALRLKVPVHPIVSWRENGRVHIRFEPAMDLSPYQPSVEDVERVTAVMTGTVERWVREHPEQWLWIHNRWKQ